MGKIPPELTPQQMSIVYASEADVLNMALFGLNAKQWCEKNPEKKGQYQRLCKYKRINMHLQYGKYKCGFD